MKTALRLTIAALGLAGLLAAVLNTASGSQIVILGDSWGLRTGPAVRAVLYADGLTSVRIHNASVNGASAAAWNSGACGDIPKILAVNPDVKLVHVILGGIDLLSDAGNPEAACQRAITNIVGVLDSIAAVTTAPLLYTGYEYLPNPPAPLTVPAANQALDKLVNGVSEAVARHSVLSTRVTVINNHGFLQVQYGIPQLHIAPFDESLPDPLLPGPSTAFADTIHLTEAAYRLVAGKLYIEYYALALKPCCLLPGGVGRFQISSVKGMRFEVEQSQDLAEWASLGVVTNLNGALWFQDSQIEPQRRSCFYRAVSLP